MWLHHGTSKLSLLFGQGEGRGRPPIAVGVPLYLWLRKEHTIHSSTMAGVLCTVKKHRIVPPLSSA